MMTAVAHKNLAGAKGYFSEHLSQNDYYAAGEHRPGEWIGTGAHRLNPHGIIEADSFNALCENRRPDSGEQLTPRQKAEGQRRVFYDFTCSAPKSVSILAITLGDDRLVTAHEGSARVAFRELERFAAARVRKEREATDRTTGNLVAGTFLHTSSRALDPQLHTHFTVFNASWDSTEHRWKALQAGGMYDAIRYATQVYRNELGRRVHQLGYETAAVESWFEIEGVSTELLSRFSKRSVERDRVVAEMEGHLGRTLSNDEISYAVHQSRSPKITGISSEEVRTRQLSQLKAEEFEGLKALRNETSSRSVGEERAEEKALLHAVSHVFERRSVVREHELLEAALAYRHGTVDLERLKGLVKESKELLPTDQGLTTRGILEQELALLRKVRDGKSSVAPIHPYFQPAEWLGQDQRAAVRHVLQSADRISGVRGLAGSGKTTMLRELARACTEAGYRVQFCAPTTAAADVLRKEGFDAGTLASVLMNSSQSPGRLLTILDEAGAVGVGDMNRLLERSGRVLLVGDTGQHASVARGDALRLIEEHSLFAFAQLTGIRRQRKAAYRKAVELAARQNTAGAWDALEKIGLIVELPGRELHKAAARQYVAAIREGRQALLVAPTWKEIDDVTRCVRAEFRREGILRGEDQVVETVDSLSWTQAQKQDPAQYLPGHQVRFHHPWEAFQRQESVEVVKVDCDLLVRRSDGTLASLDPNSAAHCLDVGVRRSLNVTAGDTLLLQANAPGWVNGERVEVSSVGGQRIQLKDGRVLPPSYRTFAHGYAVTSHAAQGKTVDEVILVASARSLPAIHQEQFYVSISRGRDACRIFTDDRERLRSRIAHSSHRLAAVEAIHPTTHPTARQSSHLIQRGIQWARQLPRRLRQWSRGIRPAPVSVQTHGQSTNGRSIGI